MFHAICRLFAAASLLASIPMPTAFSQTLGPDFVADYSIIDLGSPSGIPSFLGGITFLDNNTLLVGGAANGPSGAIYSIGVTRDPIDNYISGFSGPATFYAEAPFIDGGLAFGPDGVLFYTGFPNNTIGQIKPGSTVPDKIISLDGNVGSSVGTLQFVPAGFAGAGQLKVASFNASTWHSVDISPDGNGTFDLTAFSSAIPLSGGPEGIAYVKSGNPGFTVDSILLSEWGAGLVGVYEIDGNGDPVPGTRRDFLTGLTGAEGAVIDPVTGDFLFSTFGGGDRIVVVTGFLVVPEPSTLALTSLVMLGGVRRRRRVTF